MQNDVKNQQKRRPHQAFVKVKDARGHKVRGLWRRGERFYSQMAVFDSAKGQSSVRRVSLEAKTMPEAIKERNALVHKRDTGSLEIQTGAAVTFAALADEYLEHLQMSNGMKAFTTVNSEKSSLLKLKSGFGPIPIHRISDSHLQSYVSKCLAAGLSAGTVNRLRSVLNNTMAFAKTRGYVRKIQDWDVDWLDYTPQARRLISAQDVDAFCAVASAHLKHPQTFVDYIRLMAYSGGRKSEVLRLRWTDVEWSTKQLRFRGDITKNGQTRHINFNPHLESLLAAMSNRRRPESEFIFPTPWENHGDRPRSTFWPDFAAVKAEMNPCPITDFHTLRHFFISTAVMAGIDYMTIAAWVGHQDGGVLIGSVYGHLNDAHKQNMAGKLSFK